MAQEPSAIVATLPVPISFLEDSQFGGGRVGLGVLGGHGVEQQAARSCCAPGPAAHGAWSVASLFTAAGSALHAATVALPLGQRPAVLVVGVERDRRRLGLDQA